MRYFEGRWRSTDVGGFSIATALDCIKRFVCLPDIFFAYVETPEFADPGLAVQHLFRLGYRPSPAGKDVVPSGQIVPPGYPPGVPGRIIFDEGVSTQAAIRIIRRCFGTSASAEDRELYSEYEVGVG